MKTIKQNKPATIKKDALEFGIPTTFPQINCFVQAFNPQMGTHVVALVISKGDAIEMMRSAYNDRWVPKGLAPISDRLLRDAAKDCHASAYGFAGDWFMWEIEEDSLGFNVGTVNK